MGEAGVWGKENVMPACVQVVQPSRTSVATCDPRGRRAARDPGNVATRNHRCTVLYTTVIMHQTTVTPPHVGAPNASKITKK